MVLIFSGEANRSTQVQREVDQLRGIEWFSRAADQGEANAQYELGSIYEAGNGVPPNPSEAIRWFRLAANQGHDGARNALERLLEG
jgi:TPR repeat protein